MSRIHLLVLIGVLAAGSTLTRPGGVAQGAPMYTLTDQGIPGPDYRPTTYYSPLSATSPLSGGIVREFDPHGQLTRGFLGSATQTAGNFVIYDHAVAYYNGMGTPPLGFPEGVPISGGTYAYYGTHGVASTPVLSPEGLGTSYNTALFAVNNKGAAVGSYSGPRKLDHPASYT